jgi:hypothetical protein
MMSHYYGAEHGAKVAGHQGKSLEEDTFGLKQERPNSKKTRVDQGSVELYVALFMRRCIGNDQLDVWEIHRWRKSGGK